MSKTRPLVDSPIDSSVPAISNQHEPEPVYLDMDDPVVRQKVMNNPAQYPPHMFRPAVCFYIPSTQVGPAPPVPTPPQQHEPEPVYLDMDDPVVRQKVMNNPAQYPPHMFRPAELRAPSIAPQPPADPPVVATSVATSVAPPVSQPAPLAPTTPFVHYDTQLDGYPQEEQCWLWQDRIPLGGITLLDGDMGSGKSVFSQMLAAHVSSGKALPDGTQTIQGGVVIVAPYEEAGKGIYARLAAYGADMSCVRVLSFVPDTSPKATSSHRHIQLPNDLEQLRAAMQAINARLVILDPFMETLPLEERVTQAKLHRLLRKLRQLMIEMNATCLLTRQCPARGGQARPSTLERSMHFLNLAASRLLLAQDPTQPKRFLLTHGACRIQDVAPTIGFTITSHPENPRHPLFTVIGPDPLQAYDLLNLHPGTLHIKILIVRLQAVIAASPEATSIADLLTHFPCSTPSQVQRALRQQVQGGLLKRVGRNRYALHGS
jgi:hypothetical protein